MMPFVKVHALCTRQKEESFQERLICCLAPCHNAVVTWGGYLICPRITKVSVLCTSASKFVPWTEETVV